MTEKISSNEIARIEKKLFFRYKPAFFAAILGNLLEHYDSALFSFLAPKMATLFFHEKDPLTALILTYAILPLSLISKPLGAFFFGRLGDHLGRHKALFYSLLGISLSTMAIGFLPTSQDLVIAPLLLLFFRLLQGFFSAAETPGGALYLLEQVEKPQRSLWASFFDASTIAGVILASFIAFFFSEHWRSLYWISGTTALIALWIRKMSPKSPCSKKREKLSFFALWKYKKSFFQLFFASGFSYVTYSLTFTFFVGYVPFITMISMEKLLQMNSYLLLFDFCLLPIFGMLAEKITKELLMKIASLSIALLAIPLFSLLSPNATLGEITFIRLILITLGVAFSAPYHAWALEQVPKSCRATLLCVSYTTGAQLIGSPFTALSLWAYQKTNLIQIPAILLIFSAICAYWALHTKTSLIKKETF